MGYTTYTCLVCGFEYVDEASWVPALGHEFVNGDCTRCDEVKTSSFVDVKAGEFYTSAVAWAVEEGVTTGIDTNTFGVTTVCNRAQVVTFLYRACNK